MRVERNGPKWVLGLLAALLCASCATHRPMYLETGARGEWITCGGYFNHWESCLEKAGKICQGRGYDTIRGEEYDRTLLIACKAPPKP